MNDPQNPAQAQPIDGEAPAAGAPDSTEGSARLVRALAGHFDAWWWSPGLTPQAVGAALGVELTPEPARLQDRDVLEDSHYVPGQSFPVRFHWELNGELALAKVVVPAALPSWPEVLKALGPPDMVYDPGPGPFPGSTQRSFFGRGLTVFEGSGPTYPAVWLYPPLSAQEYGERTGAFEPVRPSG